MTKEPNTRDHLPRVGAGCAVIGVVAALTQTAIDPTYSDNPAVAIQQAARSHLLTSSRVLDMLAFLLLLIGVTSVTQVMAVGHSGSWARVAQVFFAVSAGAGAIATMMVGSFPDIASAWEDAPPNLRPGYVAAYDALNDVSGAIFAVSWATLGVFGITFGIALARADWHPRALRWLSIASGIATLGALCLGIGLGTQSAFVLLVFGLVLSYVVIVTAAIRVWRDTSTDRTDRVSPAPTSPKENVGTNPFTRS